MIVQGQLSALAFRFNEASYNMHRKLIGKILTGLLALSSPSVAGNCEFKSVSQWFSESHLDDEVFTAEVDKASLFLQLPLTGKFKGRTVQSIGVDPTNCRIVTTVSLKKKPEIVGFWSFLSDGNQEGKFTRTDLFGHPQDLTIEHDDTTSPYFWLPDRDGLGSKRFKIRKGEGGHLEVEDMQFIKMLKRPVSSHSIAVSADKKHIAIMGKISPRHREKQVIRVYKLEDALMSRDVTILKPLSEFKLVSEQQPGKEYRQGLAIVGNTVFVLTGNPNIERQNRLASYNLHGDVLSISTLTFSKELSAKDGSGTIDEPEGLEFVIINDKPALLVGMASGDTNKKTNRLYKIPLTQKRK